MRKKYYSLFVLILLISSTITFSQNIFVKNKGAFVKINTSANVKVQGTLISEDYNSVDGRFYNDGNLFISRNIVNLSSGTVFDVSNGQGNIILNGSEEQHLQENTITIENLYLANSNSDTNLSLLDADHIVTNKLTFTSGNKIVTNNNTLIISNEATDAIVGFDNQNFIFGTLRRYINGNNDFYFFPVAKSLNSNDYHLAALDPNSLTGTDYIDVYFGDLTNHNNADLVASELGTQYYEVANEGVWHIIPNSQPTSGTFDLRLYIDNIAGLNDNKFAILTRPENSTTAADWTCTPCGVGNPGLNPNNGEGRLLSDGYALRYGYDHFSEFGIGKLGCVNVDLGPADTILCNGSDLTLYPGSYVSYAWSNGSTDTAITVTTSGLYYVTVTDEMGCITSDSINVIISTPINIAYVVDTPTCTTNGNIDLTVNGGITPYTFNWNTGDTQEDLTNIVPGTYIVTVTDSVGCSNIDTIEVPNNLPNIEINVISQNNVSCNGGNDGSIEISVNGGQSPYTYQWNTGDSTNTISNLTAGTYSVTVTDANGCTATSSINITEPEEISVTFTVNDVSCYGANDGEVTAQVTGGTSPYAYDWSPISSTSSTITGLGPGQYTVTITDANGCTTSATAIVSEPTPIRVSVSTTDPVCYGDSAIIELSTIGGIPPYTYSWSNGATDSTMYLPEGEYQVTITDNNGCDTTLSINVDYNGLEPLIITDTVISPNGYEFLIDITVTGGTSPYTYLWNTGETVEDITASMSGEYVVTVTDFNGCEAYDTVIIDIPLKIPTIFTPNGDGKNDTWNILNIGTYDDVTITIFNRWGNQLFYFHGNGFDYTDPENQWDGTYNGKLVPFGEYLFVINLNGEIYKGTVLVKY